MDLPRVGRTAVRPYRMSWETLLRKIHTPSKVKN